MQKVMVVNKCNGSIIVKNGRIADKFLARLRGLLGKEEFFAGEGLILAPCSMIHSIGMRIEIDVLFVATTGEIIHIIEKMQPNKVSPYIRNSCYVVEMPAGQVKRTCTTRGHMISIIQTKQKPSF